MGWIFGVSIPGTGKHFSLLHNVQTVSGVHPASYLIGTRGCYHGNKVPSCEPDHSPATGAESRMVELYLHSPMCFHGRNITLFYLCINSVAALVAVLTEDKADFK
jgi:hypothetical protein